MQYRQLGKSDLNVSQITFGCMSLGDDQSYNTKLIHNAIDNGVNLFDTADLYQKGESERVLGRAIKRKRKDIYIATKVGNVWREDGSGWDWNPTKKYIIKAVEASLERLQTDYIDLYQLHGGTLKDPIDDIISAFEKLKKAGKIRHYGISSIRPNVMREYVAKGNITSIMMPYSLLDRRPEEGCFESLLDKNVGIIARGSLAKGLLAGKSSEVYQDYTEEEVQKVIDTIKNLSNFYRTPAQTALKFVIQEPAVTTIASGIRTEEQLKENLAFVDSPDLTSSEMAVLKGLLPPSFYSLYR